MQKYLNNVQDQFGNALSSVTVTVNELPGGAPATIYSDNGVTPKANPFTNDSDGEFFFYADNGRYDIELTGPLTESISDIRLLDIAAIGSSLVINTDIDTATPPTTEAVTGNYEIYDNENDDLLARIGFSGSNDLRLRNYMHGGTIALEAEDAAGALQSVFTGDPDGAATLYHDGTPRLVTLASGEVAIKSETSTDTELRKLQFRHQDDTVRGAVGFFASDILVIDNNIHGGNVIIRAEDSGGTPRNIFNADPDGVTQIVGDTDVDIEVAAGEQAIYATANAGVDLYYNNVKTLGLQGAGVVDIFGDLNSDTDARELNLRHADGTLRARIGNVVGSDLVFRQMIHGGGVHLEAEDTGGVLRTFLYGDPDGETELGGDTNVRITVNVANEDAIVCTANGAVTLYYDNVSALQTRVDGSTFITRAQVKHADGNFYDIGLGRLPFDETDASADLNRANSHQFIRKDAGGAISLELQNDSNIPTGTTWMICNNDTEDITIDATTNSSTLRWLDGGGIAPPTGDRTLAEAGICTVIKDGVNSYYIWGVGLT